ncbi:uncharacterized protein PAE49_004779 [Odontesthes bonariensis]|uniref:uncharacterized protein LOC142379376 n=1 Tax=Odontesthes bonariensis TaxID=219752 RepID=UPI003F581CB5
MRNLDMSWVFMVFLLEGFWDTDALSVTGVEGHAITIECSHTNAFSNVKYFCKGACHNEDVLITSKETDKESHMKYSIKDEGNIFYVTIFDLNLGDSGTYWCGIDRAGVDTYNKVTLTVVDGDSMIPGSSAASSRKLVYIGAGLGVAALALATVLLIFFRHRKRDTHASSGKGDGTVYDMQSIQEKDARCANNTCSASNDGEPDSAHCPSSVQHQEFSRDQPDIIYSNVSLEPHIQPDDLCYSTVSFTNHTDCTAVTPHTTTNTYSTLKHISKVHCNV